MFFEFTTSFLFKISMLSYWIQESLHIILFCVSWILRCFTSWLVFIPFSFKILWRISVNAKCLRSRISLWSRKNIWSSEEDDSSNDPLDDEWNRTYISFHSNSFFRFFWLYILFYVKYCWIMFSRDDFLSWIKKHAMSCHIFDIRQYVIEDHCSYYLIDSWSIGKVFNVEIRTRIHYHIFDAQENLSSFFLYVDSVQAHRENLHWNDMIDERETYAIFLTRIQHSQKWWVNYWRKTILLITYRDLFQTTLTNSRCRCHLDCWSTHTSAIVIEYHRFEQYFYGNTSAYHLFLYKY